MFFFFVGVAAFRYFVRIREKGRKGVQLHVFTALEDSGSVYKINLIYTFDREKKGKGTKKRRGGPKSI